MLLILRHIEREGEQMNSSVGEATDVVLTNNFIASRTVTTPEGRR